MKEDNSHIVHNRNPGPGEEQDYRDVLDEDGTLYAVVVRRAGGASAETLVLVQNGPALESLANLLTEDPLLSDIVRDQRWHGNGIPPYFEGFSTR